MKLDHNKDYISIDDDFMLNMYITNNKSNKIEYNKDDK